MSGFPNDWIQRGKSSSVGRDNVAKCPTFFAQFWPKIRPGPCQSCMWKKYLGRWTDLFLLRIIFQYVVRRYIRELWCDQCKLIKYYIFMLLYYGGKVAVWEYTWALILHVYLFSSLTIKLICMPIHIMSDRFCYSNNVTSHIFHLIGERDARVAFPAIQELVEHTCAQQKIKFKKVEQYL